MVIGNLDIIIKMHAVESVLPSPDGDVSIITPLLGSAVAKTILGRGGDSLCVPILITMDTRGIPKVICSGI